MVLDHVQVWDITVCICASCSDNKGPKKHEMGLNFKFLSLLFKNSSL